MSLGDRRRPFLLGASLLSVLCAQPALSANRFAVPSQSLAKLAAGMRPGDTCWLRSGTYRQALEPKHSGAPGKPIVFAAAPKAHPVISGLDSAKGPWTAEGKGLYRLKTPAAVGAIYQVFLDGLPLPENTWPPLDTGFAMGRFRLVSRAIKITPSRWCLADSGIPNLVKDGYWVGAQIWVLFGVKTSAHILPIDEHKNGRICFDHFSDDSAYFPGRSDGKASYYAIFKRPSDTALLEAGQWAFDSLGRSLRVRFAAGDSPKRHHIEYRTRLAGLSLRAQSPVRHVRVSGIDFFAASLDFAGAESCSVSGARIRFVTPFPGAPPRRDRILRSLNFPDLRWRGVNLSGAGNLLRDCAVEGSWVDGVSISGTGNAAENNLIRSADWIGGDFAPISVWDSLHRIEGNTLGAAGRSGLVHVEAGACRILRNRIADFGLMTDDFGATYTVGTDGRGTEIARNRLGPAAPQAGKFPTEPKEFATRMAGVYLDDIDSNFHVHGNRIHLGQSAYSMRLNGRQRSVRVHDNVMLDAWGALASYNCNEREMQDVSLSHNLMPGGFEPSDAGCGTKWIGGIARERNTENAADTVQFAPDSSGSRLPY